MRDRTKKRISIIGVTSLIVSLITILIIAAHVRGYERIIKVEKDSYVLEYYPDNNYGVDDYLRVGNYSGGEVQAFYYFNISSLPDGWTEVSILVNFDYGSAMVDVGANLTYESWDEMTITWNNKPNRSFYRGHILCDGFDFSIPLRPDQIINDGVGIFLFRRSGEDKGFIQGNSKEGTSSKGNIAQIELGYIGIDPKILNDLSMVGIVICIVIAVIGMIVVTLIVVLKFSKISKRRRKPMERNVFGADWVNAIIGKTTKAPSLEKEINQYITLKLENGRTLIYVNGKRFIQCIRLILNIPKDDVPLYNEVDSIDEAAKFYSAHIHQNRIIRGRIGVRVPNQRHNITPEQEFWGHSSNIQSWVEHDYDTRILMSNISFPLLRELTIAGDPLAKKIFKEEIALRLESGYPTVVQYLIAQGYIKNFSPSELHTIIVTTELIKNISSDPRILFSFLMTCITQFPTLLKDILFKILKLPEGKKALISSFSQQSRSPYTRFNLRSNPIYLSALKILLRDLLSQVDVNMIEDLIDCISAVDKIIEEYDINFTHVPGMSSIEVMRNLMLRKLRSNNLDDDGYEERALFYKRIFNELQRSSSKCPHCGKVILKGKKICDWCGHRRDDDDDDKFLPYPYIFKPPGGGGRFKEGAIVIPVRA